jgi:NitT/TauT family transport system substrate-binding protein
MTRCISRRSFVATVCSLVLTVLLVAPSVRAEPLKVGFSDWPGWLPWQVAIEKDLFKKAGVDVEFTWFEYGPSLEAYGAGKLDGISITNGDALVIGATGRPSVTILINDYSDGNDMIIAKAGIGSLKDLKGKKIGVELNFVDHLMLLKALEMNGMKESDVELVNIPTNDTPNALSSGGVDAIGCWHPTSTTALKTVAGSKAVFTSKEVPGLIYDCLNVSKESLASRKADWAKVVTVWYETIDWIKANPDEANKIMAARIGMKAEEFPAVAKGTHILSLAEAVDAYKKGDGLKSIYGSSVVAQEFNLKYGVYKDKQDVDTYIDPSLTEGLAKK